MNSPSATSSRARDAARTYLFHPQEPAIVFWQFFVGIGIVYSIIVVPFRLGYDVDATGGWYVLEMIIDGFFLVDILLNFRTAYFDDERRLIYDPKALLAIRQRLVRP